MSDPDEIRRSIDAARATLSRPFAVEARQRREGDMQPFPPVADALPSYESRMDRERREITERYKRWDAEAERDQHAQEERRAAALAIADARIDEKLGVQRRALIEALRDQIDADMAALQSEIAESIKSTNTGFKAVETQLTALKRENAEQAKELSQLRTQNADLRAQLQMRDLDHVGKVARLEVMFSDLVLAFREVSSRARPKSASEIRSDLWWDEEMKKIS
jgi:chromosome segregation ATPase